MRCIQVSNAIFPDLKILQFRFMINNSEKKDTIKFLKNS